MPGSEPQTVAPSRSWIWWIVAGTVAVVVLLALWWQANWSPSAPQAATASNPMAVALHHAAGSDGDGWIALTIGLASDEGVTPFAAASTFALLSPDGDLVVRAADAGAAIREEAAVQDSFGVTTDYVVTPLAVSAEHRSMLVRIDRPDAFLAASVGVVSLDSGTVTRVENCSASFIKMTAAGYQLIGDCGTASGLVTLDYSSGEVVEDHAVGVPEPWVWDERGDRFITIAGDYSGCVPGGFLADGRLVATCEMASSPAEYRAGAIEVNEGAVGKDDMGEVAMSEGELVPVGGDELAAGYLGFSALAAGDTLAANQSTTEGDPLLAILDGDYPSWVDIDGSAVAAVAQRDGLILVVTGTDAYGAPPGSGPALYWYDPATGESTFVASVPECTRYVRAVPLS